MTVIKKKIAKTNDIGSNVINIFPQVAKIVQKKKLLTLASVHSFTPTKQNKNKLIKA